MIVGGFVGAYCAVRPAINCTLLNDNGVLCARHRPVKCDDLRAAYCLLP